MLIRLSNNANVQDTNYFKASITLTVPSDTEDKFWSRGDIDKWDGKASDGVSITVSGSGVTDRDAKIIGMQRLLTFINNCRYEIRPSSRSPCKAFSEHSPPFNLRDDVELQMARKLMETYRESKYDLLNGVKGSWAQVSEILETHLKNNPEAHRLRRLINYYLVCNVLPPLPSFYRSCGSSYLIIKAYVRLHQGCIQEAIGILKNLSSDADSLAFKRLVSERLECAYRYLESEG